MLLQCVLCEREVHCIVGEWCVNRANIWELSSIDLSHLVVVVATLSFIMFTFNLYLYSNGLKLATTDIRM